MTTEDVAKTVITTLAGAVAFLFRLLQASEKRGREAAEAALREEKADHSKTLATLLAVLEKQRARDSDRPPISGTK